MSKKAREMDKSHQIFHITHLSNLASVIDSGGLMSDSQVRTNEIAHTRIGYEHIKARRLRRAVTVASKGFLGDYVPFNFCPRSVMLYVIHIGNVPGYDGGQDQVLHFVSTIERATQIGTPWAFTDRHADVDYALYFDKLSQLDKVDWQAVAANQWGGPGRDQIKERKQAEFLVHNRFPWEAILKIGVKSQEVADAVKAAIRSSPHKPDVVIQPGWYY